MATDAAVAIAILALVVALCLGAAETAAKLSGRAMETRRAEGELRYLLDNAPRAGGQSVGRDKGFDWRVRVEPVAGRGAGGQPLCRRTASIRSVESGRTYAMTTAEACA